MKQNKAPSPRYEQMLEGMHYPSNKAEVINHIQNKGATPEVMDQISAMPNNTFNSSVDVIDNIGKVNPLPHHGHPSNRESDETTQGRTHIDPAKLAENV